MTMTTNNVLKIIAFIIIAAALIGGGVYYNRKLDERSQQKAAEEGETAKQKQNEIMANFNVEDVVVGTGVEAKNGDTVSVNYDGTFVDGKKFDSNIDSSFGHVQPFSFTLGAGDVVKGWDLGVLGMKVGGKRKLSIPPELGYGAVARGPIPADSTLLFMVELVGTGNTPPVN